MSLLTRFETKDNWFNATNAEVATVLAMKIRLQRTCYLAFFDSREQHEHTNIYDWLTSSGKLPGHGQTPAGWRLSLWHPASAYNTEASLLKKTSEAYANGRPGMNN